MSRNSISAFTLIELLTVITIIVILAGLTVGVSSYANRNAIESRIKAEIKAMETALEAYKADYGGYPPLDPAAFTPTPLGPSVVLGVVVGVGTNFPATVSKSNAWLNSIYIYQALASTNAPKIYMSFTPKQLFATSFVVGVTHYVILDPNGNPYGYNPCNPKANPQTFDLWSAGIDSKSAYSTNLTSNVDDLGNWQR